MILTFAEQVFMARFTSNPGRFDPYKNFKFRLKFDGKVITGTAEVSGLPDTKISKSKSNKHKQPGLTKFADVTLKRGVTDNNDFLDWASGSNKNRKNVTIELFDESEKLVLSYDFTRAWIAKISGADLKAEGNEVIIESLELGHEGLEITQC